MDWDDCFGSLPLIAILRGVASTEVGTIGGALSDAGFRIIEVPLNSPDPFDSISLLTDALKPTVLVGGGTVLTADDVERVHDAGGKLVVAPNLNPSVADAARRLGMIYCPGVQTATEAFKALDLGAAALKLFPAEMIPPAAVKALGAVLPKGTATIPVGGITPDTMEPYLTAGASGFGLGSALYKAGATSDAVKRNADAFVTAFHQLMVAKS